MTYPRLHRQLDLFLKADKKRNLRLKKINQSLKKGHKVPIVQINQLLELKINTLIVDSWKPYSVTADKTIKDAVGKMLEKNVKTCFVLDQQQQILGMITRSRVLQKVAQDEIGETITTNMVELQDFITVDINASVVTALEIMRIKEVGRLLVVNEHGEIVSMVTRRTLTESLSQQLIKISSQADESGPV